MQIPSDYIEGYDKARARNPELASAYISHTLIGDPDVDKVADDLSTLPREVSARFINAAMEQDEKGLHDAPQSLKIFFEQLENPPEWFNPEATLPACKVFYKHWYAFTASLVGAGLIEGFTTGIAKSFMYTGRLLEGNQGVRRLKQNNRHQAEIFLPGGLDRQGEGWKLTLRIRLVHAQIRRLLSREEGWDTEAWGVPVSAAHIALASAVFSARVLMHVQRLLGSRLTVEERMGYMHVWRYTGYLMGVPEALSCHTEEEALHLFELGSICEPPPTMESVAMSHTLLNAGPKIAELDGDEAKKLLNKIYRVSRALIGDTLADQLCYPKMNTWGTLAYFGLEQKLTSIINRVFKRKMPSTFEFMVQHANYEQYGTSYMLPDHASAELSKEW